MIAPLETQETRPLAREIKFLVPPETAAEIKDWARIHLQPDPDALAAVDDVYTVTSLYLDTPCFDIFSRNKKFGRSKYRIRRYGRSECVFLERKLRTNDLLGKHRSRVPIEEMASLYDSVVSGWAGSWFQQKLIKKNLRPVCEIAYERTARIGMSVYGPIRLTLDENLRAVPASALVFSFENLSPKSIQKDWSILELKYRAVLPAKFKELLIRFRLTSVSFSKYRTSLPQLGVVDLTNANESLLSPATLSHA